MTLPSPFPQEVGVSPQTRPTSRARPSTAALLAAALLIPAAASPARAATARPATAPGVSRAGTQQTAPASLTRGAITGTVQAGATLGAAARTTVTSTGYVPARAGATSVGP